MYAHACPVQAPAQDGTWRQLCRACVFCPQLVHLSKGYERHKKCKGDHNSLLCFRKANTELKVHSQQVLHMMCLLMMDGWMLADHLIKKPASAIKAIKPSACDKLAKTYVGGSQLHKARLITSTQLKYYELHLGHVLSCCASRSHAHCAMPSKGLERAPTPRQGGQVGCR